MNSPLINRTPLILQKHADKPGSHHSQNSHDAGATVQPHAHAANAPGTGGAVDKSA